jgi:hypothetical protein
LHAGILPGQDLPSVRPDLEATPPISPPRSKKYRSTSHVQGLDAVLDIAWAMMPSFVESKQWHPVSFDQGGRVYQYSLFFQTFLEDISGNAEASFNRAISVSVSADIQTFRAASQSLAGSLEESASALAQSLNSTFRVNRKIQPHQGLPVSLR